MSIYTYAYSMVLSRSSSLMTEKLRKIINRDTIIIISIVGPIAAFLDIFTEPDLTQIDKSISYLLILFFILVGAVRLIRGSVLDRRPIYAIIIYQAILVPTTAYFADVRSFYVFLWIIPFYLASFYYGKKVVYYSFAVLALTQISKIIIFTQFNYITRFEDYFYMISEFFIVIALSLLVMDTTAVSEADRALLIESLETKEIEQQRLSAVMNSIQDGLVAIDEQYSVVSVNSAALNILDKHDDILGKDFRTICNIAQLDGAPIAIEKILRTKTIDKECVITYGDGEKATLSLSSVPIIRKTTQVGQGFVLLLRDITKQKTLQEERDAFVSLMAHELRTPLTIAEASASNAETILKNGDTEKAVSAVKSVSDELSNLTRITNEFSLVIDSHTDSAKLNKNTVNLDDVCSEITQHYRPIAEQKRLVFSAYVAPYTPNKIYTNKTYFMHIIESFTDNAIKFTQEGGVTVHFSEQSGWLVVSVEDSGIGIAKADQPKVFSPFYQSDDYETRMYGGLGVGLYTTKKLADLLGGSVAFTSQKDHGSVFVLRLPLSTLEVPKEYQGHN